MRTCPLSLDPMLCQTSRLLALPTAVWEVSILRNLKPNLSLTVSLWIITVGRGWSSRRLRVEDRFWGSGLSYVPELEMTVPPQLVDRPELPH